MHLPTQIELRRVEQLLPCARNSRTHSDEQIAQVAASIREFGWTNPVLVGPDDERRERPRRRTEPSDQISPSVWIA
jgi:ParB-like chromosome segregation protein Spo0J